MRSAISSRSRNLRLASPCRPLARPFLVEPAPLGSVAALDIARAQRLAVDSIAFDELEDEVAAPVAELQEALAPHRPQGRGDVLGQYLHAARVHLPAVAPRASPARARRHRAPPPAGRPARDAARPRAPCSLPRPRPRRRRRSIRAADTRGREARWPPTGCRASRASVRSPRCGSIAATRRDLDQGLRGINPRHRHARAARACGGGWPRWLPPRCPNRPRPPRRQAWRRRQAPRSPRRYG